MKLSTYARKLGISYKTAWRWFKAGKLAGYQADTGTIIVTDPIGEAIPTTRHQKIAVYTRVSAAENKDNLEGQAKRLTITVLPKGIGSVRLSKRLVRASTTLVPSCLNC
jgi:predicted site-specific integrase-resolvase